MNKFYNETLHKLETAINELEIEADCSIQRMEAVIHLILECVNSDDLDPGIPEQLDPFF